MKNLKPSKETELTAMRVVMEHERTQGGRWKTFQQRTWDMM